jgi:hypothetical protein
VVAGDVWLKATEMGANASPDMVRAVTRRLRDSSFNSIHLWNEGTEV